jgi:hypothetical protein
VATSSASTHTASPIFSPAGVAAVGATVTDIGVVTTPELHFTVQTYNQYHALEEQAYFTNLLESFRQVDSRVATQHR